MLDWLIIGGGIHGTHLSLVLTKRLAFPPDTVRVLDPHPKPLARWRQYVDNTGMRYLRSSSVHHLDIDPYSLRGFARLPGNRRLRTFKYPYQRPGAELFWLHCRDVIERNALRRMRLSGRATGLELCGSGVRVATDSGEILARRVLLAPGMGDNPCWPDWAAALRDCGARVHHLYGDGFLLEAIPGWSELLVVGGGIGAAQAAIKLAGRQPGTVTVLTRHQARIHQFDSDPGWNGPRRLGPFTAERELERRRRIIDRARYRGSIPPDVAVEFGWYIRSGKIKIIEGGVQEALPGAGGAARLSVEGDTHTFDRIILACGFEKKRPGGAWLDRAVSDIGLPVSSCGFPGVDRALRWHERIFVCGALAELELGPVARNISGARHAGHRLYEFFRQQRT